MDFDASKENIQPLKGGRKAELLELALNAENHQELQKELTEKRKMYEATITEYKGDDPLEPWYDYIIWIEQTYPKSGKETALDDVLINCIQKFENDQRYRQDRRMIKIYMKYIDTQPNPHEFYQELYNQGVGTMVADLYIGWAYYYDAIDKFKKTEEIYRKGLDAKAQPLEDLEQAHKQFGFTMSQRILYKDEPASQEEIRATLQERRAALTSLRTSRRQTIGTTRTGGVVRNLNPGIVNQENVPVNQRSAAGNVAVSVYAEEQETIPRNESIVKTLVDARMRENTHEPGPWNKAKLGKSGPLFTGSSSQLNFNIAEDEEGFTPIPYTVKTYDKGFLRPKDFINKNKVSKGLWDAPTVLHDPTDEKCLPMYNKPFLYPKPGLEYSPEELLAYRWFKKQNITNNFTAKRDLVWSDSVDCGSRLPPGFIRKNLPQPQDKPTAREALDLEPQTKMMCRFAELYPETGEVFSTEELMAIKWRQNPRMPCLSDIQDVEMEDDDCAMDETIIGDRRISIHPLSIATKTRQSMATPEERRSMLPRKSIAPPPKVDHEFAEPFAVPKPIQKPRDSMALIRCKKLDQLAIDATSSEVVQKQKQIQKATSSGAISSESTVAKDLLMKRKMENLGQGGFGKNPCMSK